MEPKNLSDIIVIALSLEATSWPKPGLVTALNVGSHKDMNIVSFLKSSVKLKPFFDKAYILGNSTGCKNEIINNIMTLRSIGVEAEIAMYEITNNINTHKGAIFIFLLLSYSVGFIEKDINYTLKSLSEIIAIIGQNVLKDDFLINENLDNQPFTTGKLAFKKFQIMGIRGIAASGFEIVINIGIPMFKKILYKTNNLRCAIVGTLLKYMSMIDDTTVMNRKLSIKRLRFVQNISAKCLRYGGYETIRGRLLIKIMEYLFVKLNISPGGAADMVSLTLAVYFWYFGYPKENVKW